jgi:hypothetical protein
VGDSFDTTTLVRRIAAFGLPGADHHPPPPVMATEEWDLLLSTLESRRITGFALAAAESGWLELTADQAESLLKAHRQAMLSPLAVERGLLEISAELDGAGVDFVVLKGPALAHTVYPDPSWRFFGDLDLLVRGREWRKAITILERMGYRRNLPEPRAGFDERFGKASEFRREAGIEVDLHRTLVVGPFGLWIEPDTLFDGTTELPLWGQTFKRLDDTLLQLHACMHASLGWWPPLQVPVRDVAQVAHYGRVDWEALADRASRWKLRAVVRDSLRLASKDVGVGLPSEAERALTQTPSGQEARALRSYQGAPRGRGGTEMSTLAAIRGIRAKAMYLWSLIFPSREFLAARFGSGNDSYLRRWAIPVRWLSRRIRRQRVRP